MIVVRYQCRRCGVELAGDTELCVSCYRDLLTHCSACMTGRDRVGRPVVARHRGRPVDCDLCHNERYILLDYTPGEKRGG